MNSYIILGSSIVLGLIFAMGSERLKIPAVAGYIVAGILGGQILDAFHLNAIKELNIFSTIALSFIAVTVGGELKFSSIKKLGKAILWIVMLETSLAFLFVSTISFFISKNLSLSLILGAVSAATAPAATVMIIDQYKTKGPLTTTLLAVVGLDDAVALIIYSFAISFAKTLLVPTAHLSVGHILGSSSFEIIGSLIFGGLMGFVYGYYLRHRNASKLETTSMLIGFVLLITGIDRVFNFSGILSSMAFGFTLINYASHNSPRVFRDMKNITPPIYIMFFVLAGTRLDISLLPSIGVLGVAYLIFRFGGKVLGASFGAVIGNAPNTVKKYIGFGLLSQVGIAVGLAVIIYNQLSSFGKMGHNIANITINILLATTVVTEIIGPILLKYAFGKAKEIGKNS